MAVSTSKSSNKKPAARPETLAEIADYVERVSRAEASSRTSIGYVRRTFRILHGLGARTRADLDSRIIRLFDAEAKGVGTSAHVHLMLRLRDTFELLGIPWPPDAPPIPRPAAGRQRNEVPSPFSTADVQGILDELLAGAVTPMGRCVYAFVATLAFADIGVLEARRLRVEDFDLKAGRIRIRGREGTAKSLLPTWAKFDEQLEPILEDWLPQTGCEWGYPNASRTGPLDTDERRTRGSTPFTHYRAAAEARGIGGATFVDLRRFHVTHFRPHIPGITAKVPPRPKRSELAIEAPFRHSIRELTLEEAVRILLSLRERSATYKGHRLLTISALALLCGMSLGEIRHLQIDDVDLGRSMLRVPGRPPVLLTPEAAEILRRWLGRPDRPDSPWVFPDSTLAGPWGVTPGPYGLHATLPRAANEAGIEGRVSVLSFSRLWRRLGGRAELGEAWRRDGWPALILDAPRAPMRNSPPRKAPRSGRRREIPGTLPDLATWDPPVPAVRFDPDGHAFVRDEDKGKLSDGNDLIIKTLLDAFRRGEAMTRAEIQAATGLKAVRQALIDLRKDRDWRREILAEREGNGPTRYRIAPW
jgi:integrase